MVALSRPGVRGMVQRSEVLDTCHWYDDMCLPPEFSIPKVRDGDGWIGVWRRQPAVPHLQT